MPGHVTVLGRKVCPQCGESKTLDRFYARRVNGRVRRQSYCRECCNRNRAAWRDQKGSDYKHRVNLGRYRMSKEAYEAMFAAQGGVCAICRQAEVARPSRGESPVRRLSVDHDHVTLVVRGLLCRSCNQGLGTFRENSAVLRAAADYLDANRGASGGQGRAV